MQHNGAKPSKNEISKLVFKGLVRRGWKVDKATPDYVTASVERGGHAATVKITYFPGAYHIAYVNSSDGLQYDGEEIHHRYNHWVRRLDNTIMKLSGAAEQIPSETAEATDLK